MKIIFASPERDLLASYGRLLSEYGNDVKTAFDGIQVTELLDEGADVLVIDEKIPRVGVGHLTEKAIGCGIRVVVMTYGRSAVVKENTAAVPFPFSPAKLMSTLDIKSKRTAVD